MTIRVNKSGFLSLVQDYGRFGFQRIGVTTGGPMDEHAYLWANRLLGNAYNTPQLEINFGNFAASFLKPSVIAMTGADCCAQLNGKRIAPWRTYTVKPGDNLELQTPQAGLRSYLAVKNGFTIEPQLNSCATVSREQLGGISANGQKLIDGDEIAYDPTHDEINKSVPEKYIPEYRREIELRFVPNYSLTGINQQALTEMTRHNYEVSQRIDRMGYCLKGGKVNIVSSGIISQGIALGAIQIPKDGQPIVLMKDRQTMGGYPLAGCVAYLDIALLAQSGPGTRINFIPVDVADLEPELILYKRFFGVKH